MVDKSDYGLGGAESSDAASGDASISASGVGTYTWKDSLSRPEPRGLACVLNASAGVLHVVFNGTASASKCEFRLDENDHCYSPPGIGVKTVSIYNAGASSKTYQSDFHVNGW